MYKKNTEKPSGKPLFCHDLICKTETVAKAISLQYTFYIWGVPLGHRLTRSSSSSVVKPLNQNPDVLMLFLNRQFLTFPQGVAAKKSISRWSVHF